MTYGFSSNPEDMNDAFARFAKMLGLDTYDKWKNHDDLASGPGESCST